MAKYYSVRALSKNIWTFNERYSILRKGFVTDGASVPWPFTLFYPRIRGDYFIPAAKHDFRLRNRSKTRFSRAKIDLKFRKDLKRYKTSYSACLILYLGVVLFGIVVEREKYFKCQQK